jgi:hypothetical protein
MIDMENIWDAVLAVVLAVAGGLARLLSSKSKARMKLSRILSELFISGFIGVMVLLLATTIGLTGSWLGLVCGMGGYSGIKVLTALEEVSNKKTGLGKDKEDEK